MASRFVDHCRGRLTALGSVALVLTSAIVGAETATAPSHPASGHAATATHAPAGPAPAPTFHAPVAMRAPSLSAGRVVPRPAPVGATQPATFARGSAQPAAVPARTGNAWPNGAYVYGYGHPVYYSYVPVLPANAGLVWWNGVPYYMADNDYYVWNDAVAQYQVVPPPVDVGVDAPPPASPAPATPVYTYPAAGQSAEQQQLDRYECYRWAVSQTGFDPTRGLDGAPPAAVAEALGAYQRAELACLVGRGYRTQ
jgi:hypothetical protein